LGARLEFAKDFFLNSSSINENIIIFWTFLHLVYNYFGRCCTIFIKHCIYNTCILNGSNLHIPSFFHGVKFRRKVHIPSHFLHYIVMSVVKVATQFFIPSFSKCSTHSLWLVFHSFKGMRVNRFYNGSTLQITKCAMFIGCSIHLLEVLQPKLFMQLIIFCYLNIFLLWVIYKTEF